MKAIFFKHFQSLRPTDEAGKQMLEGIKQGDMVQVEIRRPRNVSHHRMFWALATLVWEQLDPETYPSPEDVVTELKIRTGHYTRRDIVVDGQRYPVLTPMSISFASLDEDQFSAFFDRCCDHIVANILPGVTNKDLKAEIAQMTGITT